MPFDVAVEEPNTRVVGLESKNYVPVRSHEDSVPTHRRLGECGSIRSVVCAGLFLRTRNDLECVAVQMERMSKNIS